MLKEEREMDWLNRTSNGRSYSLVRAAPRHEFRQTGFAGEITPL